jgi:hypothetical protein
MSFPFTYDLFGGRAKLQLRETPTAVEDPVGGRAETATAKQLIQKIIET